ncbi:MAG: hypothetical protein SFV24_05975 [Gemmatimonadales bacterium]|nr:hypothetical protein [Gemmatimonadales bacterium]
MERDTDSCPWHGLTAATDEPGLGCLVLEGVVPQVQSGGPSTEAPRGHAFKAAARAAAWRRGGIGGQERAAWIGLGLVGPGPGIESLSLDDHSAEDGEPGSEMPPRCRLETLLVDGWWVEWAPEGAARVSRRRSEQRQGIVEFLDQTGCIAARPKQATSRRRHEETE